jgi:hypothetical protein
MNIKTLLKKQIESKKLLKKEEDYMIKRYIAELDKLASILCKDLWFLDKEKIPCFTCDKMISRSESNTCHFIERGRRKYRWDQDNLRVWCVNCNCYEKQRHWAAFALRLRKEYWDERVDEMMQAHYWLNKKPRLYELQSLYDKFISDVSIENPKSL